MKISYYSIIAVILILANLAKAEMRTWTRIDGKKVKAEMVTKTEDAVTIAINGKHHKVWLADLIDVDRDFVNNNEPKIRPSFRCKTVAKTSYIPYKKKSSTKIKVTLKNTKNADLSLFIVWIGEDMNRDETGVFKTDSKNITMNGDYEFNVLYDHRGRYSKQHKMHAVYLIHQKNNNKELIDEFYSLRNEGGRLMAKQELADYLEK
jgi:hypothetical protein